MTSLNNSQLEDSFTNEFYKTVFWQQVVSWLEYIHSTGHPKQSADKLTQVLIEAMSDKQETIMNFAQQLEKRGFEKSLQQGVVETARKLLAAKAEVALIKVATGFTDAELAKMKDEAEKDGGRMKQKTHDA